jgi:hypothetical protein
MRGGLRISMGVLVRRYVNMFATISFGQFVYALVATELYEGLLVISIHQ